MGRKKKKRGKARFTNRRAKRGSVHSSIPRFDIEGELEKAVEHHQSGRLEKAKKKYKKILKINPNHPVCLNLLGLLACQVGKLDVAVDLHRRAIRNDPNNPTYHNDLGTALRTQGRLDEAISCFQKVLQLNPDLQDLAGAYYNIGCAFQAQGRFDEAISCFQKVLQSNPDLPQIYYGMGNAFQDMGKFDEAILCFQKVLQSNPELPEVYYGMGNAFHAKGSFDDAISCYETALLRKPDWAEAYNGMGDAFRSQGKIDEAISSYERALRLDHHSAADLKKALLFPVVNESRNSIELRRKAQIEHMALLRNKGFTLEDPDRQVGSANFFLAYHGLNDKKIQQEIASFYCRVCPDLEWVGNPHIIKKQIHSKIKIGIISRFLYNHTIGRLNLGIIKNLSREKFHVKLFQFPGRDDHLAKAINSAADEVVILQTNLAVARQQVTDRSLDILLYLDVGMDSFTYFLAFSRLAPVQCVTWGHPVTTGIPNMDYYISSENAEPSDAEDHYSEKLALLKRFVMYFYPPESERKLMSREDFGLPQNHNLYMCFQTIYKFHPDFDTVLGAILRQDPRSLLVLFEGAQEHWTELLRERFLRVFPEHIDRVRFLPRVPFNNFLSLLTLADVVLDTPYFNGGYTSLLCFGSGIPIVTLAGKYMRGRLTLAFYKQMGVMDCVADNVESYVNIATRLANDKTWRDEIKGKIKSQARVLSEDIEAVRELERFFEWAVKQEPKRTPASHYSS
jgi:predicted O-linked N-acetylglucosamine transferase (SPINDLY family)